jgi:CO/xanthine dehydrogenase Mo-binding subunit
MRLSLKDHPRNRKSGRDATDNDMSPLPEAIRNAPRLRQWLSFDVESVVTIFTGKVELGQGILTALGQMAAEELRVRPSQIRLVSGETDRTPDERFTAGSLSIATSGKAIRIVCAQVRELFAKKFAQKAGCDRASIQIRDGEFHDPASQKSSSYWAEYSDGDLNTLISPEYDLTPVNSFEWIGKSIDRHDLPGKLRGGEFIHDLAFDDMIHAIAIRQAGMADLDDREVELLRQKYAGVATILSIGHFLAVYSDSEAKTRRIANTLQARFAASSSEAKHSANIWPQGFPDKGSPERIYRTTTTEAAGDEPRRNAVTEVAARYSRPYLCHGAIGPSCAVAYFDGATMQVWSHTQGVFPLRNALADVLMMDTDRIVIMHRHGSGCYGHNGADDVACDAAIVAKACPGRHVRVQWTRQDELSNAPYGPASIVEIRAGVDHEGYPTSWDIELWSPTHNQRPGTRGAPGLLSGEEFNPTTKRMPPGDVPDEFGGGANRNAFALYRLPTQRLTNHLVENPGVRTSALRGLGAHANVFAIESFIDELAGRAAIDPLDYRLNLLDDERARRVIIGATEMASWSQRPKLADGTGYGLAFSRYKNTASYVAIVARVSIDDDIRVEKIWCCADAGLVVNPDGALNQIEGGIIQAASWTLKEEARIQSGNAPLSWNDYPILRFSEVPLIEVNLLASESDQTLGVGEVVLGPTAAAIGNAIAVALGQRIYAMPFTSERIAQTLLEE